jgi:hypothetical protein
VETPPPTSVTTTRVVERFNERVQTDLLFVSPNAGQPPKAASSTTEEAKAEPWQHNICVCTRFSSATILELKTTSALIHAFELSWVRPYGPPQYLETDPEAGWNADEAKVYLTRLGTSLDIKGVDSHAKMLETHHQILRMIYLRLTTQARTEGIRATKDHILTCALTAKNSLFTVGDTTPMLAVFGRQPSILPNLEEIASHHDDSHTGPDGLSRQTSLT